MAIFGHLSDLPFPEIFNLLGRRTGHLTVSGVEGVEPLRLHIHEGRLRGLQLRGGEVVDEPLHVRDRLLALMDATSGGFEFHRCDDEAIRGSMDESLTGLLMSIASAVDEISAYRNRFAHPETRMKAVAAPEPWLDDDLYRFFRQAGPLLARGASARELARDLDFSLEQVQFFLYKLRSIGKVAPVRAFDEAASTRPAPAPAPAPAPVVGPPAGFARQAEPDRLRLDAVVETGRGLARRLLRALRQRNPLGAI